MTRDNNDFREYFEPPKTFVKSAARVLELLEYFYRHREPARLVDISAGLDYPVSSTKYLLNSLVESGYLSFDAQTKMYFPSILFSGLGSWLAGLYPNGEVLRQMATDVHAQTGLIVSITVQHQQYMRALWIEMDGNVTPPAYDFRVRIPMIGTAGGLVALSSMTDENAQAIILGETRKLPPTQRAEIEKSVFNSIQEVKVSGYALKEHTYRAGGEIVEMLVIAMKIPFSSDTPTMVLSVSGEKLSMEPGVDATVAIMQREIKNGLA